MPKVQLEFGKDEKGALFVTADDISCNDPELRPRLEIATRHISTRVAKIPTGTRFYGSLADSGIMIFKLTYSGVEKGEASPRDTQALAAHLDIRYTPLLEAVK